MSRVDALLAELQARHGIDAAFVTQLRAPVQHILDPTLADDVRVDLLELLAETCDRHVQIKRDSQAALAAWQALSQSFAQLIVLLRLVLQRPAAGESP